MFGTIKPIFFTNNLMEVCDKKYVSFGYDLEYTRHLQKHKVDYG